MTAIRSFIWLQTNSCPSITNDQRDCGLRNTVGEASAAAFVKSSIFVTPRRLTDCPFFIGGVFDDVAI
jgi:hypothetical protein